MILRCYSIRDVKTQVYHPPYFAPTDGAAVRIFTDAVSDPTTQLARHPADFQLYFIGKYDDASAELQREQAIVHVCDALNVIPPKAEVVDLFNREVSHG